MTVENSDEPVLVSSTRPYGDGHAALSLVESLIHGLVAKSVLTLGEAVSIVEVARDAQSAIAEDAGSDHEDMQLAVNSLSAIADSLAIDLETDASPLPRTET